jgi:hypothetical protein
MKMGLLIGVVGMLALAGAYVWYSNGNANVYDMSASAAAEKLIAAEIPANGPFGNLEASAEQTSETSILWSAVGSHAMIQCEALITSLGAEQVKVTGDCGNVAAPSSGAANSALKDMHTVAFKEFLDATLSGRAYDSAGVNAASTIEVAKHYPEMVGDALKMNRETQDMLKEMGEAAEKGGASNQGNIVIDRTNLPEETRDYLAGPGEIVRDRTQE